MTFSKIWGTTGLVTNERVKSTELNQLDADHANAVDGYNGGTYQGPITLTGPLTFSGSGSAEFMSGTILNIDASATLYSDSVRPRTPNGMFTILDQSGFPWLQIFNPWQGSANTQSQINQQYPATVSTTSTSPTAILSINPGNKTATTVTFTITGRDTTNVANCAYYVGSVMGIKDNIGTMTVTTPISIATDSAGTTPLGAITCVASTGSLVLKITAANSNAIDWQITAQASTC